MEKITVKYWEVTQSSPCDSLLYIFSGHSNGHRDSFYQTLWWFGKYIIIHVASSCVLLSNQLISTRCVASPNALQRLSWESKDIDLASTPAVLAAVCCFCCSFDVSCLREASASKILSCWLSRGTLGQRDHLITSLQSTEHQEMASSYKRSLNPTWCLTWSAGFLENLRQSLLVICESKDS